jgi:hypothetical protein
MRVYFAAVLSMLIANASFANEAFVPQAQVKKFPGGEMSGRHFGEGFASAAAIASPLSLNAVKAAAPTPYNSMNVSYIAQQGTNNSAAVSQAGGHNLSSIAQSGVGNQAVVTQRH